MSTPARFTAMHAYLQRLPDGPAPNSSVWRTEDGSAQGQFFQCTLTSAFRPIVAVGGHETVGFEGLARGAALEDAGLSVWRLLDQAASDDESIELDRLCRMLHAINFFRQSLAGQGADLYLSVHDRLLTAVSSNHGYAFLRILNALELPLDQIVLQLPAIGPASRWLANYVADNYRRNGFRLAHTAATIQDAIEIVRQFQPHAIRIAAAIVPEPAALAGLLALARDAGVNVIVNKVDTRAALDMVEAACNVAGAPAQVQGAGIAAPAARLHAGATGTWIWPSTPSPYAVAAPATT